MSTFWGEIHPALSAGEITVDEMIMEHTDTC